MRILHLTLALLLALTAPLQAQMPVQDTIPQLKEWWRADNLQYGKYGMTLLDNFYNGKGALVVWTPLGVKTWLLRFPGDTINVFSWEKGSSNIKTGDFNGDGITDYVDENGNIYEGIKNGEPPKAESVSFGQYYPEAIVDLNGDGNDDIINTPTVNRTLPSTEITICFGKQGLKDMNWQAMKIKDIDSNNAVLSCYPTANHEIRLVCRRYFWYHDAQKQKVIQKDGYRLVRVWWEGKVFKSEVLDEFTVDIQNGTGIYWVSGLHLRSQGKYYLVSATQIGGNVNNTNVTVYDLSKDKIEKLFTTRMDGVKAIHSLRYGLDFTEISSLCIQQYSGNPILHIYNGNIINSLKEIAKFTTVLVTSLISLPDVTGDKHADIALSNEYDFSSATIKYRFSILNFKDTVSSIVEEQYKVDTFSIQPLPPMPIMRSQTIKIKITVSKLGSYTLSLYDSLGKKIFLNTLQMTESGENYISFDLSKFAITSGKYILRLEGNNRMAQCNILIN